MSQIKTIKLTSPTLNMLRNQIDFSRVPFSDCGSRLLVYQVPGHSQMYIKLAERLTSIEPGLETYLLRPAFINDFVMMDGDGHPLDFELTSFPHILYLSTRLGDFSLLFRDNFTLAVGLPPEVNAGIRFLVSSRIWKMLEHGGEIKSVRDLTYASNAPISRNLITPQDGGYLVEFAIESGSDSTITLSIGADPVPVQDVPPFSSLVEAAEQRWQVWFRSVPPVAEPYRRAYAYAWWVMANNLIKPKGSIHYEAMMPSKSSYVGLWLWDSAMHALAYRHVDPQLARNQIRAMLACQLPDGMLPDAVYDEGIIAEIDHPIKAEVTKPPILAWVALKLHDTAPDLDFLKEIYIPLVRWNAWWFSQNDDDVDGLAQYNHPYSSGLDNNPLWDYGMPVESPDLNTYLCVQMNSLARIANLLGMDAEAAMWRRRSIAIVQRMIKDFYDDETGLFYATFEHERIPVVTPFNLYPLWTGKLPNVITNKLLHHLTNPEEFWLDVCLPSVSKADEHYDPESMWRGPAWANINYFFVEALQLCGHEDLAQDLRNKTLEMIMRNPGMYEYYNSQTGEPGKHAAEAFGWTAAVFIDMAISASQEPHPKTPLPDLVDG